MAKKSNEVIQVTPEYKSNLDRFVATLTAAHTEPFASSSGRKFDKVYRVSEEGKKCAFMVRRADSTIFGTKSWVMINYRRLFGTLSTIGDWTWTGKRPMPISGTVSETEHKLREAGFTANYGPRGRPKKALASSS